MGRCLTMFNQSALAFSVFPVILTVVCARERERERERERVERARNWPCCVCARLRGSGGLNWYMFTGEEPLAIFGRALSQSGTVCTAAASRIRGHGPDLGV